MSTRIRKDSFFERQIVKAVLKDLINKLFQSGILSEKELTDKSIVHKKNQRLPFKA